MRVDLDLIEDEVISYSDGTSYHGTTRRNYSAVVTQVEYTALAQVTTSNGSVGGPFEHLHIPEFEITIDTN